MGMVLIVLFALAWSLGWGYALVAAQTRRAEEVAAFFMLLPLSVLCAYVFVHGGN